MRFKFKSILPLLLSILLVASTLMTTLIRAEEFVILGNGEGSDSQITATINTQTSVTQTSSADVANNVDTSATTGENEASGNSGDTVITTGDIQEDITVGNTLNSSFVETPCCLSDTFLEISGNGSNSQNAIDLIEEDSNTVVVNQTANITNSITGNANTGDNTTNNNGGNVTIETGSIWANSTIKNGPVNFYDIKSGAGGGNLLASINENGLGSTNTIAGKFGNTSNVFAGNVFNVNNNVFWDLNTGRNTANGNMGDVLIKTGDVFLNVLIENIANLGKVVVGCCGAPEEPPNEPEGPDDPGKPNGGEEMPPPNETTPPSQGLSPAGPPASQGGPSILGLSDTSSPEAQGLLFLVGLIMIAGGLALTFKGVNVKEKISPARAHR